MKREKTTLRKNAALAKTRLINGFWNQAHEKVSLEFINNPNGEEEQLYNRVAAFLEDGCENPLTMILDQDYMSRLAESDRQRYVLNMSCRVNKSIERYLALASKVC